MTHVSRADYFERPAEKLVLEGYRCWTRGYAARSTEPWTEAQLLYRGILGDENGEQAIIALAGFVRTLGCCASCPLRMYRSGSPVVCRDETLVMGMIAAIQNGDQPTLDFCLERLCNRDSRDEVAMVAGVFALKLRAMGQMLRPIPRHVLASIVTRSERVPPNVNQTIH